MKTKYLFITLLLSSLINLSFAQLPVEQQKDNNYRWSVAVVINSVQAQMDQKLFDTWVFPSANYYAYFGDKHDKSISLSIIPKYKIRNDIALRFEFGLTSVNLQSHYNGAGDTVSQKDGHIAGTASIIKDDTIRQKIYRYGVGAQCNIFKKKFIESYCGMSLYYLHYSEMHWSDDIKQLPPGIIGRGTNYIASTPGGFATGVGMLAGVNVYLNKRVSIGGEFSYSLLYYKLGGVQNGIEKSFYPNPMDNITQTWTIYNNASKGIQFSKIMPSFNISVHL